MFATLQAWIPSSQRILTSPASTGGRFVIRRSGDPAGRLRGEAPALEQGGQQAAF